MSVFQVQQRQVKVATSHANERNEQRASQRMSGINMIDSITASLTTLAMPTASFDIRNKQIRASKLHILYYVRLYYFVYLHTQLYQEVVSF